jgi:hypothetical protein
LRVGGIENRVHGLVMAKPAVPPCKSPMCLKGGSSKWIHDEFSNLNVLDGRMATAYSP